MTGYRLSRSAELDLELIFLEGLDRFGSAQAERYKSELKSSLDRLSRFPGMAHLRMDVSPPVRIQPFRAHVIVFDVGDEGITVVRIRHGREDWMSDPVGIENTQAGDEQ